MSTVNNPIITGATTAFIDASYNSNIAYKPAFISNNHEKGEKVLSSIEDELRKCDSFIISVAFITMGGIVPLLQVLQELESKGVKGKILTTDYNTFTDPKALDKLAGLSNIELRMYHEISIENLTAVENGGTYEKADTEKIGFHTKGYIFRKEEAFTIIIGSSNMTLSALTVNKEWNTKVISTESGEFLQNVTEEFNQLWNDEKHTKKYDDFIDDYRARFEAIKKQRKIALDTARNSESGNVVSLNQYKLSPNKMQVGFINSLRQLIEKGEDKALLISATGTGKTYASAFGVRDAIKANDKMLFLVHREQIAKQALKSFSNVFGKTKKFGLLLGNSHDMDVDYLFSTMQMMAKPEIMERFEKDEFPVIVIDEAHRTGAGSYQKIMEYFEPKFLLGMTASPERTDSYDVFATFDHNIALEIRLQQALDENLLCPFHYFGITDLEIDGETVDEETGLRDFNRLTSDARVNYITEQIEYYGYSGERVKGLIFCSSKKEAVALSQIFNQRGYRTKALTGEDNQEKREEAIELLTRDISDLEEDHLDYILTVDIFNEGVDIPEINQVVLLRPTESPIVFVQQLGRGLRKATDKEYVVILDFIGNYKNNFMIPIALSGDRTYNKDNIRRYVMEGGKVIPGSSTIHFDEISRKRIFEAIDQSTTTKKMLVEKYNILKNRLGKIPSIVEFYEHGEIDPMLFIEYSKESYHKFLQIADKEYKIHFSKKQEDMLAYVSQILVNGKRPHELLMLKQLLDNESVKRESIKEELLKMQVPFRNEDYESAYKVLSMDWLNAPSDKKRYSDLEIIKWNTFEEGYIKRAKDYYNIIVELTFKQQLRELIEFGLMRYRDMYSGSDENNLMLYQKYSRKDVCRILNWEKDDSSTVYGYRYKYGTCPIFVTYEKKEDIASSTKYEDQFVDNQTFSWMTRSKVSLDSKEAQQIIHSHENGDKIFLFVKKSDGEGTDFYYMGEVIPTEWSQTTIKNDRGEELPIVNFRLHLKTPVRDDLYEYLRS